MMPAVVKGRPGARKPRFRRVAPPPHEITERDLEIVCAVARLNVVRSTHFDRLFPQRSRQQTRRRLQILYHAGVLERPKAQKLSFLSGQLFGNNDEGRPTPLQEAVKSMRLPIYGSVTPSRKAQLDHNYLYTLGPKGSSLLRRHGYPAVRPKEFDGAFPNLMHAAAITDFLVSAEVACREFAEDGLTYLPFEHILRTGPLKTQGERMPGVWPVDLRYGGTRKTSYVQPDGIFGFQLLNTKKFYMLEVDNGTMPVVRKTPQQTSLLRKLLAYGETHRAEIHKDRFGMGNMRALFVVPSAGRRENLKRAFREHVPGVSPQLFLTIDQAGLAEAKGNVLLARWQDMEGTERLLVE